MRMRILLSLALLTALAFPSAAEAACSNPAGVEGEIIVNSDFNVPAYCDDTNWIAMKDGEETGPTCPPGYAACGGRSDQRLVFSGDYNTGNLGGVSGADTRCQNLANANGLNGTYKAWVADSNASSAPAFRFEQSTVPYVRIDGTKVADNWSDLTDGTLDSAIAIDATGAFTGLNTIRSNVATDGTRYSSDPNQSCLNWTTNNGAYTGWGGRDDVGSSGWTVNGAPACGGGGLAPYCFEQKSAGVTQIVPTGLIGHWRLDETSGTTAYDSSGNGNNLTTMNNITASGATTTGLVNSAFEIPEGAFNSINISGTGIVPTTSNQPFTITAWVYDKGRVNGGSILEFGNRAVRIYRNGGHIRMDMSGVNIDTNHVSYFNKWTMLIGTFNGTNAKFYRWAIDGSIQEIEIGAGNGATYNPTGDNFKIGATDTAFGESIGLIIDDIRLYNRELTTSELEEIYAARDGIRYNESMRKYEYFDGNKFVSLTPDWKEVDEGEIFTPFPDLSCPNVGDVCSDGSVYAGLSPDGNKPMYTTPADEAGTYFWNNGNGAGTYTDTMAPPCDENGPGSVITTCITGELNTANIIATDADGSTGGIQPNQAAQRCADLTFGGNSDWYLPAMEELWLLYNDRVAIGGFSTGFYWSSSEDQTFNARRINFGVGAPNNTNKNTAYNVRCVRRADNSLAGTSGLIGHWKMDETSGTTIADSSGEGNNGTFSSPVHTSLSDITVNGPQATGFDFKRQRVGFSVPYDTSLNTTNITVAAWVQFNLDNSVNRIVTRSNDYQLEVRPTNGTIFLKLDGGANTPLTYPGTFVEGRWYHIAGTFNDAADTIEIFVDGVSLGTTTNTESYGQTTSNLQIAENGPRSAGGIDDLRIYNRVLSAAEITDIYNIGSPIGSSTALPQGCPNIGDICDNGTVYAGLSPDGSVRMFTTPVNAPNQCWNNCNGPGTYTLTSVTSRTDGDGNTAALITIDSDSGTAGFQTHEAAQYCYDLVAHGSDDWYLPATDEVLVFYTNKNAGELAGTFPDGNYLNSTEESQDRSDTVQMASGSDFGNPKLGKRITRCARKGPAPRCANPYGLEGQMIYNSTHDVVQFCDGARWIAVGK